MEKVQVITELITFRGVVQGVGFRPTVARIAKEYEMNGQVRNMGGLVRLVVTDQAKRIDAFVAAISARAPRAARIDAVERIEIDTVRFDGFAIAESAALEDEIAIVPPDIAICDRCLAELREPANPRAAHAFISCTDCGPRYTIMERLPYDRDTTSMDDFTLCARCAAEYAEPESRRYHAQTVSCHDCGPQPLWAGGARNISCGVRDEVLSGSDAIVAAARALNSGGVIALKGVGGYYFACSPFNAAAVTCLREIKLRDEKPFAVMFSSLSELSAYCKPSAEEAALLQSSQRPIVLLEHNEEGERAFAPAVCGSSRFVGALLPSMGLQYLLLAETGPLVMTSANLSELPIMKDEDEIFALRAREPRLAGALYHTRRIVTAADDSVARVIDGSPQLIRRAKGYVPTPVFVPNTDRLGANDMVFAAGGQLKSALAFSKGSFVYLSQYMGDLDSMESETVYLQNFTRMKDFFNVRPGLAVCDLHPRYITTAFAEDYAAQAGIRLLKVQHHHAHVASVMAEHGLDGPVIGVAFDGTGYGTDGAVWGGEILICEGATFTRFSHLRYIEMLGGDASMKDAWKAAVAHAYFAGIEKDAGSDLYVGHHETYAGAEQDLRVQTGSEERSFSIDLSAILDYAARCHSLDNSACDEAARALRAHVNVVPASAMGRLFDAAAAMLGLGQINHYEGQCAALLEAAAARTQLREGSEADFLALQFHSDVASAILKECRIASRYACTESRGFAAAEHGIRKVCLSGGVFQNRVLMDMVLRLLRDDGFEVYYNIVLPPNDGGIALGQCYIGMRSLFDEHRMRRK